MGKVKNNILVTGGAGFIGSHLVEELAKRHKSIFVPYLEIESNSYFAKSNLKNLVTLTKIDLRDKEKVFKYLKTNDISFIFHLAAQTIVTDAYKDPYFTLENNIISTLNLLEYTRLNKTIKGIIIASSDKAYGKSNKIYIEDSPLKGDHPYDVSKSAKDLISQAYIKTYNTPIVLTRFGNVYGEGDLHMTRIIPGICSSLALNETLQIRSDGTFVRDYIYVKDVVNAYMTLYANFNKVRGQAFNVSSSDKLSVLELIKKVEISLGKKVKYSIKSTANNEIPYQHLNWQKIKNLGWKPVFTVSNSINRIYEWYATNLQIKK